MGNQPGDPICSAPDLSDVTRLINLLEVAAPEQFHSPDGEAYLTFREGPSFVAWPMRSAGLHDKVARMFYQRCNRAPSGGAVAEALRLLAATALYDGPELPVFVRVGGVEGELYLDLADQGGHVVIVTPHGWGVTTDAPVKFRRPRGMGALPEPEYGGTLSELALFCNVAADDDLLLVAGVLCSWLRPTGPYPVLVLHGDQGTAKSTTTRLLKQIVDPGAAALRTPPQSIRDLMIAARNTHVLSIDNMDRLSAPLSDALCRLSTGGGFTTRQLYSDTDEVIIDVQRPVILNGIGQVVTRPDLLDRSVVVELPRITSKRRIRSLVIEAEFAQAHPRLLGAVLDAAVEAMATAHQLQLKTNPRMVDFAAWGAAVAPALSRSHGEFENAYAQNRDAAVGMALESSWLGPTLAQFITEREEWRGEAMDLLIALGRFTHTRGERLRIFSVGKLSAEISRLRPALLGHGIEVIRSREGKGGRRILTLRLRQAAVSAVSDEHGMLMRDGQGAELAGSALAPQPIADGADGADGTPGPQDHRTPTEDDGGDQ